MSGALLGRTAVELEDWAVDEVWLMLAPGEHTAVDITANVERKINALMCHRSQLPDPEGTEQRVREWWERIAVEHGLPEGRSAEAFRVIDTR